MTFWLIAAMTRQGLIAGWVASALRFWKIQQKATKGTRITRRRCPELLKRLSGKEKRFQALVNHTISHRIVTRAKNKNQVIALEDQTGIRERTN
ncbi:MAG: hypothetical protein WCD53_14195 [Microcoleus sp.]